MSAFPFRIVGFDLDGTLLDTSADLAAAVNHALGTAGRPPLSVDEVKPMIGGGTRLMLERGLNASGGCHPELVSALYPVLIDHYRDNIAVHTVAFDGLAEALDALDAKGAKLAVVTNKLEALAVKLLDALDLSRRFAAVIGGDTMGKGNAKPSAAPIQAMVERCGGGRAAFVGDSIYDILAARNAGIASVAVGFGFLTQPVEELGADAVVEHFDALLPTLERLGAR